jgi:hypothetical protein
MNASQAKASRQAHLNECKAAIEATIERLVAEGMRKVNIEIELTHFIKAKLYKEESE